MLFCSYVTGNGIVGWTSVDAVLQLCYMDFSNIVGSKCCRRMCTGVVLQLCYSDLEQIVGLKCCRQMCVHPVLVLFCREGAE